MSLEYVILGWLSTGPGSGYDLVRAMDFGVNWFWSAPHSQIYPKLKALEDRGWVESESTVVGDRLEKRVYSITEAGRAEVDSWTAEPPTYPPNRDVERIKLIFGDTGDLKALRAHFRAHLEHYQQRLETLRAFLHEMSSRSHTRIERRIESRPTPAHGELTLAVRNLAYRGDIKRAENEVSWAQEALDWLDAFEAKWDVVDGRLPDSIPEPDPSARSDKARKQAAPHP
ncbi:helix-turn-helix transcriptional regulator [Nocardia sp. R7R-8]|uniref:helix-turn-helix transcriptional regulator n=1 Tax=Nocardia sp. R7R-8 TaxID=3459304 RepID=UPI00403DF839